MLLASVVEVFGVQFHRTEPDVCVFPMRDSHNGCKGVVVCCVSECVISCTLLI